MSEEVRRVEVITSVQRRRRWSVAEKIRLVEETLEPGMSVSFVARKHGLSPSLLFKWRQRMAGGGRDGSTYFVSPYMERRDVRTPRNLKAARPADAIEAASATLS